MTKILPTQDDYEADRISTLISGPDLSISEKEALLQDPEIIGLSDRLGGEVGINGEAPHKMQRWQDELEQQRQGISHAVNAPAVKPEPQKTGKIAGMFLQNELDEGVKGAKIVPIAPKKALGLTG